MLRCGGAVRTLRTVHAPRATQQQHPARAAHILQADADGAQRNLEAATAQASSLRDALEVQQREVAGLKAQLAAASQQGSRAAELQAAVAAGQAAAEELQVGGRARARLLL